MRFVSCFFNVRVNGKRLFGFAFLCTYFLQVAHAHFGGPPVVHGSAGLHHAVCRDLREDQTMGIKTEFFEEGFRNTRVQ